MSVGVERHHEDMASRDRGVFLAAFAISIVLNLLLLVQLSWRSIAGGFVFQLNGPLLSIGVAIILALVVGRWVFLRRLTSETLKQIAEAQAEGRAVESNQSLTPRPPLS